MQFLNRDAIIVLPKKPFLDWVNYTDPENPMTLEELRDMPNIYLIPETDTPEEKEKYLEKNCQKIFKHELFGYWTDEEAHPKDLSLKVFKEWFEYEFSEMIADTLSKSLTRESFGDR